jgi:hypothetical protein
MHRPSGGNGIAFSDHFIDGVFQIGKGSAIHGDDLLRRSGERATAMRDVTN